MVLGINLRLVNLVLVSVLLCLGNHRHVCVLLQTRIGDGLHDFDTRLPNLRDGNVDDLLNFAIGNTFFWKRLDHPINFLPNL